MLKSRLYDDTLSRLEENKKKIDTQYLYLLINPIQK